MSTIQPIKKKWALSAITATLLGSESRTGWVQNSQGDKLLKLCVWMLLSCQGPLHFTKRVKVYSLVQTNSCSVYRFDSLDTLVSFWAHNILHMTDKFATMYAMEYPSITRGLVYLDPSNFENGPCHNISKKGRVSHRCLKIFRKCSPQPFFPGSLYSGERPPVASSEKGVC